MLCLPGKLESCSEDSKYVRGICGTNPFETPGITFMGSASGKKDVH